MVDIEAYASGSRGNCYKITDGRTSLLLECGIPFKEIQRHTGFRLSGISGVLITHEHMDHAKAVKDMMRIGVDCYMSQGTKDMLAISGHRVHVVNAKEQFVIGTWTIMPFETQHDSAEPIGFLLSSVDGDKVLYATDTYYIRYKFPGLTHIIVEANHSYEILDRNVSNGWLDPRLKNRLIKSHFSLENLKEFFLANDLKAVREIWLIHLSDGNSDEQQFKKEIAELTGKPVYIAG